MAKPDRIIRITAKRDGFRRAGMAHPAKPTDHDAASFSADQLAALKAEAMLIVEVIEDAKPAGGKDTDAANDTKDTVGDAKDTAGDAKTASSEGADQANQAAAKKTARKSAK